jgi:hypothetical protein
LDSVGFYEVFNIREQCPACSEESARLSISDPSKTELTKTMFEAHNQLSELNDHNREIFKNVVEALKNKLVSQKNGQSA